MSEENALKHTIVQATRQSKDFIAFDQGLKIPQTFCEFDRDEIAFVTRCNEKVLHQKQEDYRQIKGRLADGLGFVLDSKVYLYRDNTQLVQHSFCLIDVVVENPDQEQEGRLIFLTNLWDF